MDNLGRAKFFVASVAGIFELVLTHFAYVVSLHTDQYHTVNLSTYTNKINTNRFRILGLLNI